MTTHSLQAPIKRRRHLKEPFCQVCALDLVAAGAKTYCVKKRVCPQHLQAEAVQLPGQPGLLRFCHQCGKFEPLDCFDGDHRACRARLQLRRMHHKSKRHCSAATRPAATAGSPSCSSETAATAADTATCSAMDTSSDPQLQQFLEADNSCAAAVSTDAPAFLQQQQHQQLLPGNSMEVLPDAALAAQSSAASDDDFEEFLLAIMRDEAQKCLQEQQEEEEAMLRSQQAHCSPTIMLPGLSSAAVLGPIVVPAAAGGWAPAASAASPAGSDQASGSSSTLSALDVWAGITAEPQAAAAANQDAAQRRHQLQRQLQDIEYEQAMRMQQASGAAAALPGLPGPLLTAPSVACSAVGAALPLCAQPHLATALSFDASSLLQRQEHEAAEAILASQKEAAVAARMALLQGQLQSVQAQINQLRQALQGSCANPQQPSSAGSAITMGVRPTVFV